MELAAQLIEPFFEWGHIEVQLRRQSEETKIVHRRGRLNLAASATELRNPGCAARPAGFPYIVRRRDCRFGWLAHRLLTRRRQMLPQTNSPRLLFRFEPRLACMTGWSGG